MNFKTFTSHYWQQIIVIILAISIFCFWLFVYPFVPLIREISVLFLWNSDYLTERIIVPGGLAQYVGEGLAQFFINPFNGAFCYAVLFIIAQQLSAKWISHLLPRLKKGLQFVLSLLIPAILWCLAMSPDIPLTPTIATILVLAAGVPIMYIRPESPNRHKAIAVCIATPITYWLTGPIAILLVLCCLRWALPTIIVFTASMLGSSYLTPYPLEKVALGIDYYWTGDRETRSTYEEMECDMLMRQRNWSAILRKYPSPESPAVTSAVIFASHQEGQLSRQDFLSLLVSSNERQLSEPTLFSIENAYFVANFGSLSSAFIASDIAYQVYWPNIAQRTAFDAMEYIPNNNKSGRALKRLAEISIITQQYDVARKYLSILEETTFYRGWAKQMRTVVEHPDLIKRHPIMQKSLEAYENTEDVFFI
jgi:hypothetical protein